MHIIDSIRIDGFRGSEHSLHFKLDSHVNFFIGRNGTGKTSLINLVNAAMNVDVPSLLRAPFAHIQIRLKRLGSNSRPSIAFTKKYFEEDSELGIECSFQMKATEKPEIFNLFSYDNLHLRFTRSLRTSFLSKPDSPVDPATTIRNRVNEILRKSWLSVNRFNNKEHNPDSEKQFESPVDRKLHQISNEFGSYFSVLDKQSANETDRFQTAYFLSLISPPRLDSLHQEMKNISPHVERAALQEMFSEFRLKQSTYSSKLDSFTKRMTKSLEAFSNKKGMPGDDFLTLTDTLRIHDLAKEWHALQETRRKIYEPKIDFIDAINNLFYKKTISINQGNQPELFNDYGHPIPIQSLSSGEKQLIIILGETLLQRRETCIFLADEPEISLHIEWQERLVPSLRTINPNAQVLFATHSPDIVGSFQKYTFDLERML